MYSYFHIKRSVYFSLQRWRQYNIKQKSDENKEKH